MPKPTSARQYGFLQAVAHGHPRKSTSLSPESAREGLMEISASKRSAFQKQISKRRKGRRRGLQASKRDYDRAFGG